MRVLAFLVALVASVSALPTGNLDARQVPPSRLGGSITQIIGPTIDIKFGDAQLPKIYPRDLEARQTRPGKPTTIIGPTIDSGFAAGGGQTIKP
jgi:hypothetical protein